MKKRKGLAREIGATVSGLRPESFVNDKAEGFARVIKRKWYRFSWRTFRFPVGCARNSALFQSQDEQAVSGLRPESFPNDTAESLRG